MVLCRIKTIEQLRYQPPGELGILLGLDRIPEVKTLRKKIKILGDGDKEVEEWCANLSKYWMDSDPKSAGVLYVDGHVRVYHGSKTNLPRRYVARERLCLRGITDYWVNDHSGLPFFVINNPFTDGLLSMLRKEIVPRLLEEVPKQPSEAFLQENKYLHRFILVFDREGYSPVFFKEMWDLRIACQTYHKFPGEDWAIEEFSEVTVELSHEHKVQMKLAERGVRLRNGLWVREIRKLTGLGHQTSVISTAYTLSASFIGGYMFVRWSQENFFKYMMQNFAIDRLITYNTERTDETKKVVNPQYRILVNKIRGIAGKYGRKLKEFAEITLEKNLTKKQVAQYETIKGLLKEEIDLLDRDLKQLKEERSKIPKHLSLEELPESDRFQQFESSRKQFIDAIKMIAYRAETSMATILRKGLNRWRWDEARSILREIFTSEADLIPDKENNTLTVQLHNLTNKMTDRAVQQLAEHLNATKTIYPGTNLKLIFKLVSEPELQDFKPP